MKAQFSGEEFSRRTVLKTLMCGTAVTLVVNALPTLTSEAALACEDFQQSDWATTPGVANWRYDGFAKVTGAKVYARDYRARDMASWPDGERVLQSVRVNRIDRIFEGYDLSMLPEELLPLATIDAQRIAADGIQLPSTMEKPFFVSPGTGAAYSGQPAALLIFKNFDVWRKAAKILTFNDDVVRYGASTLPPPSQPYNPTYYFVRDGQEFSYVKDGNKSSYLQRAEHQASRIEKQVEHHEKEEGFGKWTAFSGVFHTQPMDPYFMEPEAGLAWYDGGTSTLNLVLGTQSPTGDLASAAEIFASSDCAFSVSTVDLTPCYPGGGFGGRDESYFPMYLALASAYSDGPIRWAYSRFEQFQMGLKRHETDFQETIYLREGGKIEALDAAYVMNGGGRRNLSPYVSQLACLSSNCAYEIPRAIASGKAMNHPTLIGGSQRGFGGPQAFLAIETLLDQAATDLNIDPIELRRRNLVQDRYRSGRSITGAPYNQKLHLKEVLDKCENSALWKERRGRKEAYKDSAISYGTGFALSNQAYGTSGDGMYGAIEIQEDGKLHVISTYIDMGNGAATGLGLSPAYWLGANASEVSMGQAQYFNDLGLTTDPSQKDQPNYVLKGTGSSSACLSAFYMVHAIRQAAEVLYFEAVLPSAHALWKARPPHKDIQWKDGMLTANGHESLSWPKLWAEMEKSKRHTTAAVHASYVSEFVSFDFKLGDHPKRMNLDYIALGRGAGVPRKTVHRFKPKFPPDAASQYGRTTFAPCGNVAAVTVHRDTGEVRVVDMYTAVVAGSLICEPLVAGQSEGGIAMAIGWTLMEDCPNGLEGPSNGRWNLDKYTIPRQIDVPSQDRMILETISPEGETTARGIAEAVMCSVSPAIINAIADATQGTRFTKLPITRRAVLEALQ